MSSELFRRQMLPSPHDSRVLIDSQLGDTSYVESFGFEWTHIDGFIDKEVMSHGHIYGRFLLPSDYFKDKTVADIGCGNGRIGRLVAPKSGRYIGLDLSESVYAFPRYLIKKDHILGRASGTDLPLSNGVADVTICWGVLHHMDDPDKALEELIRVTKPGGDILIFIYSRGFDSRENFNRFAKNLPENEKYSIIESTSDLLDGWREVDSLYANLLSGGLHMSVKQSREWQIFQWFDGVTPQYHWSLEERLSDFKHVAIQKITGYGNGCYKLERRH